MSAATTATAAARDYWAWATTDPRPDGYAIEARAANVRRAINLALAEARGLGLSGVRLHAALLLLADRVQALAAAALAEESEIVAYTLPAGQSLFRLAADFYGDASRWAEIADLNDVPNPTWLPAGTALRLRRE